MVPVLVGAACLWWHFISGMPMMSFHEAQPFKQNDYESGLRLRDEGHWEKALKTWWSVRNQLELRGESDPRIGIAFIELATEKGAKKYYGTASDMYMSAFSFRISEENQAAVIKEAERSAPLLGTEKAKHWRKLIDQRSPNLSHEIRLFWLEKDSRPATQVNERLIEHWQRISYARRHFKKNRMSVYGCDDRGTIYVKYGKPLRTKSGFLGTSGASIIELMRWISRPSSRAAIRTYNPAPEYEVWLYDNLGTDEPTYFLFSLRDGTGTFGLRDGVETTISGHSGRRYIYQIMYYAELESFAEDYEMRYHWLEEAWQRGGRVGRKLRQSYFFSNKIVDKTNPSHKYADVDKSDYEKNVGSVNIVARNVRLLDSKNRPQLAVIAISSPQFKGEQLKNSNGIFEVPAYQLHHYLIIRDDSLREIDRMTAAIPEGMDNVSIFQVEHSSSYSHFSIAAEARLAQSDTLLAIGKIFLNTKPPLNPDPDSLEISDLVLGVEFDSESEMPSHLPLPLLPTYQFNKTDPMQVYLEVYHLKSNQDGNRRFTIEFSVHKLDKKGKGRKKGGEISLTFEFEAVASTSKEYSGVNLSKLKPGDYELTAKVQDTLTCQVKSRRNRFRVEE